MRATKTYFRVKCNCFSYNADKALSHITFMRTRKQGIETFKIH